MWSLEAANAYGGNFDSDELFRPAISTGGVLTEESTTFTTLIVGAGSHGAQVFETGKRSLGTIACSLKRLFLLGFRQGDKIIIINYNFVLIIIKSTIIWFNQN
jgi:hypothetical protein